jgi:indolepyruvate ferredoxin oxidoreductase alpha subunit
MKRTLRGGIFPGDIGCYTLGVNLGAVDACHCMGAGISQAAGFYRSLAQDGGAVPPIAATIGDSTFFHAGIPALINAVAQGARIIVVILDNGTTAMTGHQPTPQQGRGADGGPATPVAIPDLVRACGVRFLREHDPYDLPGFTAVLREADAFRKDPDGGPAVVIARHPCVLDRRAPKEQARTPVEITAACTGCRHCVDAFECPALVMDEATGRASVVAARCTACGVCVHVCPVKAIRHPLAPTGGEVAWNPLAPTGGEG